MPGRRLTLIRHCATAFNEQSRYQGHEQHPLSPGGRAQAERMRRERFEAGSRWPYVWTSDLRRSWETAELLFPGVPQRRDPRLRELDFGAFSGANYDENLAAHGERFERWLADPGAHPIPDGESLSDLWTRAIDWAEDLPGSDDTVAVLHVGSMKAVVAWALGLRVDEAVARYLPIGAVIELEQTEATWHTLSGWDDGP